MAEGESITKPLPSIGWQSDKAASDHSEIPKLQPDDKNAQKRLNYLAGKIAPAVSHSLWATSDAGALATRSCRNVQLGRGFTRNGVDDSCRRTQTPSECPARLLALTCFGGYA